MRHGDHRQRRGRRVQASRRVNGSPVLGQTCLPPRNRCAGKLLPWSLVGLRTGFTYAPHLGCFVSAHCTNAFSRWGERNSLRNFWVVCQRADKASIGGLRPDAGGALSVASESTYRHLLFRRGWSVPGWGWPFQAKRSGIVAWQRFGRPSGLLGGRPPAPKGGRSLQQGRSGHHSGWKRCWRWPSRVQFTVERMPRLARDAAAPQVLLVLSLSPSPTSPPPPVAVGSAGRESCLPAEASAQVRIPPVVTHQVAARIGDACPP